MACGFLKGRRTHLGKENTYGSKISWWKSLGKNVFKTAARGRGEKVVIKRGEKRLKNTGLGYSTEK